MMGGMGTAFVSGFGGTKGLDVGVVRVSAVRGVGAWRMSAEGGRTFFVGGNWKCNGTKESLGALMEKLNAGPTVEGSPVEVALAPPFPYLEFTRAGLRKDFLLAAQDCWVGEEGAYTGEVSVRMLRDLGCDHVIIGHSERRHLPEIKETDEIVARKTSVAIKAGITVVLCIGELLEEREAGQTFAVCERQLKAVAEAVTSEEWASIVVAYEPVWAIGTGKVATPKQAQEVHHAVRDWIKTNVSPEVADAVRILYGGSVSKDNCRELARQLDVDGFLVGGASLKPDFLEIVDSHKEKL